MPAEIATPRRANARPLPADLPPHRSVIRSPWWLWPHLLSLDAPLVAWVWQQWWARAAGVRLSWVHGAILFAGVWLIYLADRLVDTSPNAVGGHETARHAFYRHHRRALQPVAAASFICLAGFAPWQLPVGQFVAGLGLASFTGGYFLATHRCARLDWPRIFPKEAVVGGMFMVGTAFFVMNGPGTVTPELRAALPLFGGLCFFNCAFITKWERNPRDLRETSSLLNAFPLLTARLDVASLGLAVLGCVAAVTLPQGKIFAPIAFSALLLTCLDRTQRRFSADALRVLADAVLLTPGLCFFLLP